MPPNEWFDYRIFKGLFPPLPGETSVNQNYRRFTDDTTSYTSSSPTAVDRRSTEYTTSVDQRSTAGSTTTFTWGEKDFSLPPSFQSLLRRPGETAEEYQVRQDIAELSCTQGGHTWLKDPASELQVCEHCGGIGL